MRKTGIYLPATCCFTSHWELIEFLPYLLAISHQPSRGCSAGNRSAFELASRTDLEIVPISKGAPILHMHVLCIDVLCVMWQGDSTLNSKLVTTLPMERPFFLQRLFQTEKKQSREMNFLFFSFLCVCRRRGHFPTIFSKVELIQIF